MVLDSQITRPQLNRRYMASRRSRPRVWPWGLAAAVLVLGLAYLLWPTGESGAEPDTPAPTDNRAADASNAGTTGNNTTDTSSNAANASSSAGMGSDTTAPPPAEENVSTFHLGRTDNQSSAGSDTTNQDTTNTANTNNAPATDANNTNSAALGNAPAALKQGMNLIEQRRFVEGRRVLSDLLFAGNLTSREAQTVRDTLASVNKELVFSENVQPNDPVAERYTVQSGDLLVRIARRYKVPYPLIERINNVDARRLQVGQRIKLIKGPFHVRVDKSDYRMDLVLNGPDGNPLYIRSYAVGLGEANSTPVGKWVVSPGRKVTNPAWRNPRTSEYFKPDDPANPIGEYWIAIEGIDQQTADLEGYGIHGTIEPDSIGSQASMGCIRLRKQDIEQVYHMLYAGESTVVVSR